MGKFDLIILLLICFILPQIITEGVEESSLIDILHEGILDFNTSEVMKKDDSNLSKGDNEEDGDDYADEYKSSNDENTIEEDKYAGLKRKLGVSTISAAFRSTNKKKEKDKKIQNRLNSLVISSILASKNSGSEPVTTCLPSSVRKWKKKRHIAETGEKYSEEENSNCDVKIPELTEEAIEKLNQQIETDKKVFGQFPKGKRPRNLSVRFRKAAKKFAEKYLISERLFDNYIAKVAFFKEHPGVNTQLLAYGVTIANLVRKDCSNDVPNSIEVDNVFFKKATKAQDYNLNIREGIHDTTGIGLESDIHLSNDPEETKLDYHREDSLFHAFHALFHRVFESLVKRKYSRSFELFFYTHQQILRRAAVEREVLGIKPLVPLNPPQIRKPLGPGYQAGWFAWDNLGNRIDNCEIPIINGTFVALIDQKFAEIHAYMKKSKTFEEFGMNLDKRYHTKGHTFIAVACSAIYDPETDTGDGVMSFSEVSARDPIFYRWHAHIEDIAQQFRDTKPLYKESDFLLYDGVEVERVSTVLSKNLAMTEDDVRNLLITHWEHKTIQHDELSSISYNRLNHLDFKYEIEVKNRNKVKDKVFVRLWLGVLSDKDDLSSYQPKYMIEMDQFAHKLSGEETETIERQSKESAATMKEIGTTLISFMEAIRTYSKDTTSWCGYPHNLLVPRSLNYNPEKEDLGGKTFVLMAFVTSAARDVTAGSDGIEHMLCGHKDIKTKLDGKPFGFPFDKQFQFKLTPEKNFLSMTGIQIIYRPNSEDQEEMGRKINERIKRNKTPHTTTSTTYTTKSTTYSTTSITTSKTTSTATIGRGKGVKNGRGSEGYQYPAYHRKSNSNWERIWNSLLFMLADHPELVNKWL